MSKLDSIKKEILTQKKKL